MSKDPPTTRIGDSERDDAVTCLQEHHASGRLSPEEFDDRMGQALEARTVEDLRPLFDDLPAPHPDALDAGSTEGTALAAVGEAPLAPSRLASWASPEVVGSLTGVVWVATIIAVVVFKAPGAAFIFPVLLMPALMRVLHANQSAKQRLSGGPTPPIADRRDDPREPR